MASRGKLMEPLATVELNQVLVALVKLREVHATAPGLLVDVEPQSEWFVSFNKQPDPGWVILTALGAGAAASIKVSREEPAFSKSWQVKRVPP
jgi:hypothetical protein